MPACSCGTILTLKTAGEVAGHQPQPPQLSPRITQPPPLRTGGLVTNGNQRKCGATRPRLKEQTASFSGGGGILHLTHLLIFDTSGQGSKPVCTIVLWGSSRFYSGPCVLFCSWLLLLRATALKNKTCSNTKRHKTGSDMNFL